MAAVLLLTGASAIAANVTLTWDPSPSTNVVEYRLYYGTASRAYTEILNVGPATTATVTNLVGGTTYYFAVTTVDDLGLESDFSDEVSYTPPVVAVSVPAQLAISETTGQIHVTAMAVPGSSHTIEGSDDMTTWVELGSITADSAGRLEFMDAQASDHQKRFYRFKGPSD